MAMETCETSCQYVGDGHVDAERSGAETAEVGRAYLKQWSLGNGGVELIALWLPRKRVGSGWLLRWDASRVLWRTSVDAGAREASVGRA